MAALELDFGKASLEGYTTPVGPVGPPLDPNKLLQKCNKGGVITGARIYFTKEAKRDSTQYCAVIRRTNIS